MGEPCEILLKTSGVSDVLQQVYKSPAKTNSRYLKASNDSQCNCTILISSAEPNKRTYIKALYFLWAKQM